MATRQQIYRKVKASVALVVAAGLCQAWAPIAAGEDVQSTVAATEAPKPAIDFARDVQPLLASRCVKCHGPEKAEAGLRLDDRDVATGDLESGLVAIAPGLPDESELLRRVTAEEGERMPPEGAPLTSQEVDVLKQWIAAGADWPAHWAYQPLEASEPPTFDDPTLEAWVRTPIDRFILKGLLERGLRPSSPADRRTLLRRVYFDLIGLPPTPEEVDAFLANESPDAYENVVDRLLASPRYGERWARHWMDVVHYADSHGFEHDMPRSLWPYRDYLVRAFNSDKPYAEFVREQVAGDAIKPGDAEALTATGLLATGPWDLSALQAGNMNSIDYLVAQNLDRDDIVSTVMSTFVSSTVHCARCHDHKFDPIAQSDYYALQAVVAGIDKAPRQYDADPAVAKQRETLLARHEEIQRWRDSHGAALLTAEIEAEVAAWEAEQQTHAAAWEVLDPVEFRSANGSDLVKLDDRSLLASGVRPEKDAYTVSAETDARTISAVRLEIMADPSLPLGGPGRQDNGNLHLTELTLSVAPAEDPSVERAVTLVRPRADFNQMPGWSVEDALDQVQETGWGIYPEVGRSHCAVFELAEPIVSDKPVRLTFTLHQNLGRGHLIGRLRLAVAGQAPPKPLERATFPSAIAATLDVPTAQRTDEQRALLAAFYLERKVEEELAALPEQQTVYCGTNQFKPSGGLLPSPTPRPIHLLGRGEINAPGSLVSPGALDCIPDLPGELEVTDDQNESLRRVALADWLVDPRNVLTWRSIANRIWHFHFGQGIVDTPNDFGRMGSPPTHPELLDWMAIMLRDQGGSLKALHRLIVTSAAYRQSSVYSAEAAALDAGNRFLWRMNSRRLDAEAVRDAMLQFSGQLNLEMGGPPVKQFLETKTFNLRPEADYQHFDVDDPANNRRSIYRFIYRTMPDPLMTALDCPEGNQLTPARSVSITALQALALVNDKFVIRQSEHLAERLAADGQGLPQQIVALYRLVLSREPRAEELAVVTNYAEKFGMANACRFLLNTNEFAFVD